MFGMVHDQGNGFHGFVPPREPPAAAIQAVPEGHVYKENKLKMAKHSGIFPKYGQQGIGELARKYQRELLVHPTGDSADYVQTLPVYVQGLSKKRKAEEANLYSHDEVTVPQAQCRYLPPSPVLISSSSGNRVVPKGTSFTRRQMQQFAVCNSGFFSTNTAALTSVNHYSTHASTTTTSKANTKSASTQGDYAIIVGEVLHSSNEAYEVLAFLGRGTFGQVVKCRCQSNRRCVAIKILKNLPSYLRQGNVEIQILQTLSQQDTESHNIVRAIECFQHKNHMCFVFELLEQNLYEYLKSNKFRPLSLPEIRPIAQQVLTALSKLKSLGLIHADLKPENIMLVSSSNGAMRYRVKVIDFGSACHSSKAVQNTYLQSRYYRAPEILLGLPFNEAIDMWSLGCVIAELFLGWPLYPGSSEYDQMRYIVETQGLPPADLLQNAGKCGTFFVRDPYTCEWRLKTQEEYTLETGQQAKEARKYFFTSLSQICEVTGLPAPDDPDRDFEIGDRHQFASLLSLMLKMRPSERVVPDVSLSHPFITMVHLQAYPFSKRFHESVALMQVCHEATRRQQAQNVRNNIQQFGSLPSLSERRSGEVAVSSVLPSPVSSNRGAEGDQYEISKNSINNAGTAVAYYAAAAVAAAALGKPTPQISPGERRPSDSNYFKQHKLSSLVIDTHQQLSGASASADHSCQANYPANAAATVLLNQNSADAFIRSNQSNPISGSGGASVPHSISLYDLVAAGGNALSLLNAVAAPVSSGTASVNPIPARHIQLSPTSSHDYLHRFQQPFQPICSKPKIQGHLPSEAEHAVLVLSSYLGRDRESRLQQTEPQKLGASVGTADICDTLNAFVQQQQQLCRNSNVFEAAQQQNLTTYQQELLAIPPAVDYNATSLISRHPSCAMALASQNSLFQNSLGHTTRMNIHHSRQRQLVNFQYQLPPARLDPGCLVAEQEPKIQVNNVKPFTTSAIPLGDNPNACLQQSSQGYSTVLLQQQRPHHEQSASLHYRPDLISFAPVRASFSTQSEKSPNPLSFPGFGDNAPMNLVTTNETVNNTAEPESLGVFSMEPLPSGWASQPELSVKQRTSGSLAGSQAVVHNLDLLPQMSVGSALNSTADNQFAVPTAARPKGISGKSDSQLFSSDGCSEEDFQSSIGQTNGDPSDLERISESEKSNLSEVGECKPTMNAYVTPIRNPPSQRSDKKIPVGRVQPMIKQEDTSSAIHFLSSPNLNCMSGAIGESLGPSLYGNTNLQCAPHCGVRNTYHQILARKSPDRTVPTSGRQNFRKQHQQQQPQLSFSRTDHQVQSNRRLSAAHAAAAAYHNLMFFQLQQQQLQQQTQRHLQNQVSVSFPPTMSATINSVHLATPAYQTQHRIHLTPNETCWPPTEFDDPATAAAASYYAAAAAAAAAVAQREQQQQQQQQQQQLQSVIGKNTASSIANQSTDIPQPVADSGGRESLDKKPGGTSAVSNEDTITGHETNVDVVAQTTLAETDEPDGASKQGTDITKLKKTPTDAEEPEAQKEQKTNEEAEAEEEEADEEDDDGDEDNDDEDEEDEDEEKENPETLERFESHAIHVPAPERAPNYPALFTHCQYFYIGAGRWQVYVQMWFVEERLKRETYVQVLDYEWHDYEHVAELFMASHCLNPVDRPSLVRLLALARHNCALIDGELRFPGPLPSRPSNFDAFELHEKLMALRLHQQAREQLQREGTLTADGGLTSDTAQEPSLSTSGLETGQPNSVPAEKEQPPTAKENQEADLRPKNPDEVAACADHVAQLQEQQRGQNQPVKPVVHETSENSKEPTVVAANRAHTDSVDPTNTLFLDVGTLAPRNAYCALCDTHEYLHHVDLPAYLISPCYHCREALAREAKVPPEILLDLHLQHNIPWPAFLQARFNLPTDGHSIEELISYDCRWRSRQPCRCFVQSGGPLLPPCVEFPWLCPPTSAPSWDGSAPPATGAHAAPGHPSGAVTEDHKEPAGVAVASTVPHPEGAATTTNGTGTTEVRQTGQQRGPDAKGLPPQAPAAVLASDSITKASQNTADIVRALLPCSSRHPRGAPTTCCHGIQFPLLGVPNPSGHTTASGPPHHTPPTTLSESCPPLTSAASILTNAPSNVATAVQATTVA